MRGQAGIRGTFLLSKMDTYYYLKVYFFSLQIYLQGKRVRRQFLVKTHTKGLTHSYGQPFA